MHLPIRQDWVDAGASLRINQPKDKLALRYDFHARPPSGTRMRYSELAESAAVMARGIKAEAGWLAFAAPMRSEEHTSELQSLMRISYAVFCLKKKKHTKQANHEQQDR